MKNVVAHLNDKPLGVAKRSHVNMANVEKLGEEVMTLIGCLEQAGEGGQGFQ